MQAKVKAKIVEAITSRRGLSFTYQKLDEVTGRQYSTRREINPYVLGQRYTNNIVLGEQTRGDTGVGLRSFHPEFMSEVTVTETVFETPDEDLNLDAWVNVDVAVTW